MAMTVGFAKKLGHLAFEDVNVLKRCVKGKGDAHLLSHHSAARDVPNPQAVQHNVRCLRGLSALRMLEDGIEKRDAIDHKLLVGNLDPVTGVVRVLYEQEDARSENLLARCRKGKRQRQKCSGRCG